MNITNLHMVEIDNPPFFCRARIAAFPGLGMEIQAIGIFHGTTALELSVDNATKLVETIQCLIAEATRMGLDAAATPKPAEEAKR